MRHLDRRALQRQSTPRRVLNNSMAQLQLPKPIQKVRTKACVASEARAKPSGVVQRTTEALPNDRTVPGTKASKLVGEGRRAVLVSISSLSAGIWGTPWAWAEETTKFVSQDEKFEIVVPAEWKMGTGKASGSTKAEESERNVFVFYPDGMTDTNISVLVTPAAADFTKMGSFGTPFDFGSALVNSLDRGFMKKKNGGEDVQEAKLIDAKEKNGAYIIEYTLKKPNDVVKYFYSSVCMAFDGKYNRLYTATGTVRSC